MVFEIYIDTHGIEWNAGTQASYEGQEKHILFAVGLSERSF